MQSFDATADFNETLPQLLTGEGPWTVVIPDGAELGFVYSADEQLPVEHIGRGVLLARSYEPELLIADLDKQL